MEATSHQSGHQSLVAIQSYLARRVDSPHIPFCQAQRTLASNSVENCKLNNFYTRKNKTTCSAAVYG